MKVKLIVEREEILTRDPLTTRTLKVGDVVERPDSYKLIQHGIAEPFDEEARLACGMSPEGIKLAAIAAERARLGIHPDEFDLYKAGIMNGYNSKGKPTLDGSDVSKKDIREFREANRDDDEDDGDEILGSD